MNQLTKSLFEYTNISNCAFKPVTKYTRSGQSGKYIQCTECESVRTIYHFNWSALTCPECKESIDKYDWLVETKGS